MNREVHVPFCERLRGKFPQSTHHSQHWVLDVQFGEDANRARTNHSAENLALIRRMALNLLRNNGPTKDSLKRRKLRACLNDDYRFKLLFGTEAT